MLTFLPAEMQVQSVVPECVWTCRYNIWSLSPRALVAPAAPSVVRGRWVLSCPGFSAMCRVPAGTSGQFPRERRDAEEGITLSPAAEFIFVFHCLLPPLSLKL